MFDEIEITDEDISLVSYQMEGYDFSDDERSQVIKSMETYDPLLRTGSNEEIIKHALDGKRRLAELFMIFNREDMALEYIEEGLRLSPSDSRLQQLKAQIKYE